MTKAHKNCILKTCKVVKIKLFAASMSASHSNKNFETGQIVRKFHFRKSEPFNRKFRKHPGESQTKQKFPLRNFLKFRYTSQLPNFLRITENVVTFAVEISGIVDRNFWSNGKRPFLPHIMYNTP